MNYSRHSNLIHQEARRCICAAWLLALLLALPSAVQAQFTYYTYNGTITITGYTGPGGAVTIPGRINGLPVVMIAPNAFLNCFSLTNVTIPDTVTSVGADAFYGCIKLLGVTIPNSVTNIGDFAFYECYSLNAITVDPQNTAFSHFGGVLFDKTQSVLIVCPAGFTGDFNSPTASPTSGRVRSATALA